MEVLIRSRFQESAGVIAESEKLGRSAAAAAQAMISCLKKGGTIFACGNGGSAEQAQHFVGELVGKFQRHRRGLAAAALGTNSGILSAIANDYRYEDVFSRELQALAKKGDVLAAFSTSGNSKNVIEAVKFAKKSGIKTIGFLGSGGALQKLIDIALAVPSVITPRVQEAHLVLLHTIAEVIEDEMIAYEKSHKNNS